MNMEKLEATFESALYRSIAAYQRGELAAVTDAYNLLMNRENRPVPQGALPALNALLKIKNEDIQIAAASALGSMGEGAKSSVNDLKDFATSHSGNAANAAVCAIGQIPGEASVTALVEILDRCKDRADGDKALFIVETCALRAKDFTGHLDAIQSSLRMIYPNEAWQYQTQLNKIRMSGRQTSLEELSPIWRPDSSDYLDVPAAILSRTRGRIEGDIAETALNLDAGLILDDRFLFKITEQSEVGIKIHRHPLNTNRYLVILSQDQGAYGNPLSLNFEVIAWAVQQKYALQDAEITWIEHTTADSGYSADDTDSFEQVSFDAPTKNDLKLLENPQWAAIGRFKTFLETWKKGSTRTLDSE